VLGARFIIGTAVGGSGLLALFYQVTADWGFGWLCALRVIQGVAQAGLYPPQASLFGRWSPKDERTTMVGITSVIAMIGILTSNSLSPYICETIGWPWVFYIYGIISVLWSISWISYYRNSPAEMPWISTTELLYIQSDLDQESTASKIRISDIPWVKVFTNKSFWAIATFAFTGSILDYVVITLLPEYLDYVQGFHLESSGILSSVPIITNLCLAIFAALFSGNYQGPSNTCLL